jgi:hypothetical protein
MPDGTEDAPSLRRQGLFPSEAEIARRLSQSPRRWRAIAPALEREGLPRVDPFLRARYWPAVVAYFHARYGVRFEGGGAMTHATGLDGPEHWDAC